uniref:Putative secreted protein n=1 Tax=Anopheles darlingi TaxID=43151 RepID=A0A2M4DRK7_ANODA
MEAHSDTLIAAYRTVVLFFVVLTFVLSTNRPGTRKTRFFYRCTPTHDNSVVRVRFWWVFVGDSRGLLDLQYVR